MEVRVLVIDDSASVVEALTGILSGQGYVVESCVNGESGWSRLTAGAEREAPMPDLVLLDLNMPGIDGLTLLRRLRADERFALLPVVILTVEADSDTRMAALEAGANDYLPKPVQTVELLARVKALLGWKLAERLQQRRMELLVEAGRTLLSTLDLDTVLQRVMQIATVGMEAEGTSVWLQDSNGGLICRAASGEGTDRLVGVRMEPGQGIAGWALQHKQSVLVPDVHADPRFYRKVGEQIGFQTQEIAAVPLLVRGVSIGVLEAVNKKSDLFSPADLAWLEVLAPLAAAAIANARLFQTLRQRTIQLQARNEELDAFAHTVAHDLKTPLASVVGFAETLEEDHARMADEELRRYLHLISRSGRKMGRIVDELLLLAGVRKMAVRIEPLDMGSVVTEATQRVADLIEESQADVIVSESWPTALGYGPWVEEVWVNYLSNALKYGGRPPRVELGATPQSDGKVRFWIRDNGPGLASEAQDRLFTPFTRLDRGRVAGHGLGLSIVRRIVEKLGGQVGVESEEGAGSVFWFTLRSRNTTDKRTNEATGDASPGSRKTRPVVVEAHREDTSAQ
jgi:signal transduction histidine kinase/CheY-like chemotaxis protein